MSANPTDIKALPSKLEQLVQEYVDAKRDEDHAKAARLVIEERILALVPPREEGSSTFPVAGYKVTTTGKLSYKAEDLDALSEVTRMWDSNIVPIRTTKSLDETGCKYLRQHRPDLWKQLANVITISPAKTSISVKV